MLLKYLMLFEQIALYSLQKGNYFGYIATFGALS